MTFNLFCFASLEEGDMLVSMKQRYTIEDVKKALTLPDFDAAAAQQLMTPLPRINKRVRPSHLPGKAREGCPAKGTRPL